MVEALMNHLLRPLVAIFLAFPIATVTVGAKESMRKQISDREGKLVLAKGVIGGQFAALPRPLIKEKPEQCVEDLRRSAFDCEYRGADGALYLMSGSMLGRVIIPDVPNYRGVLPVGIKRTDGKITVLNKLRKRSGCATCWQIVDWNDIGGQTIMSGLDFVSKHKIEFGLSFDFDGDGVLRIVRADTPTN